MHLRSDERHLKAVKIVDLGVDDNIIGSGNWLEQECTYVRTSSSKMFTQRQKYPGLGCVRSRHSSI